MHPFYFSIRLRTTNPTGNENKIFTVFCIGNNYV